MTLSSDLVQRLTVAAETSNDWLCHCPFHQSGDPKASLVISKRTDKILAHCFGACGRTIFTRLVEAGYIDKETNCAAIDGDRANLLTYEQFKPLATDPALVKGLNEFERYYGINHHMCSAYGVRYVLKHYFAGKKAQQLKDIPGIAYPYMSPNEQVRYKFKTVYRYDDWNPEPYSYTSIAKTSRKQIADKGLNASVFPSFNETLQGNGPLYVTAGEEKALLVNALGFRCVSVNAGEGNIDGDLCKWLVRDKGNHDIVLCLDNDKAGDKGTRIFAAYFERAGAQVFAMKYPADFTGDVNDLARQAFEESKDWKHAHGYVRDILAKPQVYSAQDARLSELRLARRTLGEIVRDPNIKPPQYLVTGLMPTGGLILGGKKKTGKTKFIMQAGLSYLAKQPFLNCQSIPDVSRPGIIWLDYEMGKSYTSEYTKDLLDSMQLPQHLIDQVDHYENVDIENPLQSISDMILLQKENNVETKLIIIDTLGKVTRRSGGNEDGYNKAIAMLKPWAPVVANNPDKLIVFLTHLNANDEIMLGQGVAGEYATNMRLIEVVKHKLYQLNIEGRAKYAFNDQYIIRDNGLWRVATENETRQLIAVQRAQEQALKPQSRTERAKQLVASAQASGPSL